MTDFTDFGLEDLLDENSGRRTAAKWAAGGLGLVFFLLSSLTTAAFFFTFAPGLGLLFGPDLAPYVAAAVGVLTLDLASLVWSYVRAYGCSSERQQTLSLAVGVFDLVGALTVSGLYVLLAGSSLDTGVRDAAGALTDFGQGLHLLGTVLVTAGLTVNFGSVWAFTAASAETRAATQKTKLTAAVREGQYTIATMHTKATVQKSLEAIAGQVPAVSDEAAAAAAVGYVRKYYKRPQAVQLDEGQPSLVQPSSNGHTGNPTSGRK
jgi:hypothetical protein